MKKAKKILALFLSALCAVSSASCGTGTVGEQPSNSVDTTTATTTAPATTTEAATTLPEEPVEAVNFSAGYARVDISPDKFPVPNDNGNATSLMNPLYATVVAVSDGENEALFISLDTIFVMDEVLTQTLLKAKKYGVPEKYVFINSTHNHSSVRYNQKTNEVAAWKTKYGNSIDKAIKEALNDLTPTTAEIGRTETDKLAFVRRYYMNDGKVKGIHMPTNSSGVARHETEADPELQVIRFNREGKKDIVMANWQAHAAHAVGLFPDTINADFVHYFRKDVEEKYDVLFAYYQGAAGNINLNSDIYGNKNFVGVGQKLAVALGTALENAEPATLGMIQAQKIGLTANIDHSTDNLLSKANTAWKEYNDYLNKTGTKMTPDMIYAKYGFNSRYHITCIIRRSNLPKTVDLPISAISFGDISFASAPYEMFDTNGMYIKDNSRFKTTFVCAYTNGHFGYIPSALGYQNGGYEAYISRFEAGTGELVAEKLVEMLNKQYEN